MIYNEEPIDALWDITRGLMFNSDGTLKSDGIKIYREAMTEEANDVPDSYIQLRSQITDTTSTYGDGKSLIRSADCDIMLISKGYAEDTNDLHNINKRLIRQHLKAQEVPFQEFNIGYDATNNSTQHTFTTTVYYYG